MPLLTHVKGRMGDIKRFINIVSIAIPDGLFAKYRLPIIIGVFSCKGSCNSFGIEGVVTGLGFDPGRKTKITVA